MEFLKSLFSDSNKVQLQNVSGALIVCSMVAIAFINILTGKSIEKYIFDSLMWLCITCLGVGTALAAIQGFGKPSPPSETVETTFKKTTEGDVK